MIVAFILAALIILILLASLASARQPTQPAARRAVDPPDPIIDPDLEPLITPSAAASSWPDADDHPVEDDDFIPDGGDFGGGGANGSWDEGDNG